MSPPGPSMSLPQREAIELLNNSRQQAFLQIEECADALTKFYAEDDWSFVIKSHALIERAVTGMLIETTGDDRLKRTFERLPLSYEEMGKLSVAKEFDVLTKPQRRFIRTLSQLRNNLVHKVKTSISDSRTTCRALTHSRRKNGKRISSGSLKELMLTKNGGKIHLKARSFHLCSACFN